MSSVREVSPNAFAVVRTISGRRNIPVETLCEGVIAPDEAGKMGMSWAQFCTLADRLMAACGGPTELQREGACAVAVPELGPAIAILRTVAGVRGILWANFRWGGPSLFRVVKSGFAVGDDGRYLGTISVPDPHEPNVAFFHLCAGVFQALPRALGLPDAQVEAVVEDRLCTYFITPPPTQSAWQRFWWSVRTIYASRDVLNELGAQNERLTAESKEAQRARLEAEAERQRAVEAAGIAEKRREEAEEARAVADRERAAAETARAEAVDALRVKSEFINTMSHELRTPLNGILGMTQLMLQGRLDADQRDGAETILSSGNLLLRLINDILDFAKMDAGQLVLDPTPFDVRGMVEEVLVGAAGRVGERALDLFGIVDPRVPATVRVDGMRLRQVVSNLVDNAVKFTATGEVVVRVEVESLEPLRLGLSVSDTGIGISAEQRARIFQPFMQGDNSTTRLYGGTGLGLTICSRIVGALGGLIRLDSEPGRGSRFAFGFDAGAVDDAGPILVDSSSNWTPRRATVRGSETLREALRAMLVPYGWVMTDEDPEIAFVDVDHRAAPVAGLATVVVGRSPRAPMVLKKPLRREDVRALLSGIASAGIGGGKRKVLVLDDDPVHKRIVARAVTRLGHELAGDDHPDVVVLTLVANAKRDAVGEARKRWAEARVVAVAASGVEPGNTAPDAMVAKPLDIDALGRALAG